MRLTEKQKAMVLESAKRHIEDPSMLRVGSAWGVIGHDLDDPRKWTGALVHSIDVFGVWWVDITYAKPRRRDVVDVLKMEASR